MNIHPLDAKIEHEQKQRMVARDIETARYELAWLLYQLGRALYWSGKQVSGWGCQLQMRLLLLRRRSEAVQLTGRELA